jgi:hypothetical protein
MATGVYPRHRTCFIKGGRRISKPACGSFSNSEIRIAVWRRSSSIRLGGEIGALEVGRLVENLLLGHPSAEPTEDIPDCNSQAADAEFPPRLPCSIVILMVLAVGIEKPDY